MSLGHVEILACRKPCPYLKIIARELYTVTFPLNHDWHIKLSIGTRYCLINASIDLLQEITLCKVKTSHSECFKRIKMNYLYKCM
ncbi:hypothetical protein OIU79_025318 [Salix purpurea]|uniref:Uncharacterized protein n=1 Tax=Salix purpurea TaxID=77065 RepID=A0A9Q0W4V3_SALPP|nr:hypothetical protein OIU79_025318 [Salix purpurea]